jgi:hypothetical protein
MEKINILVCPSDRFGVYYHRSKNPHESLGELYNDEFNIEFNHEPNWSDLSSFEKYHIIQEESSSDYRTVLSFFAK